MAEPYNRARSASLDAAQLVGERLSCQYRLGRSNSPSLRRRVSPRNCRSLPVGANVGVELDSENLGRLRRVANPGDVWTSQCSRRPHPKRKAEVYRQLGLRLTYDPTRRVVIAESDPRAKVSVGEPTRTDYDWRLRSLGKRP